MKFKIEVPEEFFATIFPKNQIKAALVEALLGSPEEKKSSGLVKKIKEEIAHFSSTKNEYIDVKDMNEYHILHVLANKFSELKSSQHRSLLDDAEFLSLILNLASRIETSLQKEEDANPDCVWFIAD